MSEKDFLNSTLRQILNLERMHTSYFRDNLKFVANEIINAVTGGATEENENEEIYVESFSELF